VSPEVLEQFVDVTLLRLNRVANDAFLDPVFRFSLLVDFAYIVKVWSPLVLVLGRSVSQSVPSFKVSG
jgi:hypothetical protein